MENDWQIAAWKMKPAQMFDLTGRVAIVTGGASGLGRAIALGLDSFGASVVLADKDRAGAEEVAAELHNPSLVTEVNVTVEADAQRMVQETLDRFGKIDISFNIPGINRRKPVLDLTLEEWQAVVDVNITGAYICARAVGKVMLEQKHGSMINMGSARSLVGGVNQSVYSVTKSGVAALTKCLAAEWAPYVRVNALAPGHVKTPLVKQIMKDQAWYEFARDLQLMKRFADPEEIVGPAVFLASDASSFMTGAIVSVDGGWTAV